MTIAGKHTVAELEEFFQQKNSDVLRMAAAFLDFEPKWLARDKTKAEAFRAEFSTFIARWKKTSAEVQEVIRSTTFKTVTPAEDAYQDVIRTLQRTPGLIQKGDFNDLSERLAKEGVEWDSPVNQPTVRDIDLDVFKQADSATKDIEAAGKTVSSGAFLIGSGVLVGILATVYLKRR